MAVGLLKCRLKTNKIGIINNTRGKIKASNTYKYGAISNFKYHGVKREFKSETFIEKKLLIQDKCVM